MDETEMLRHELEHYRNEKERIRRIVGQIGGRTTKRQDRLINIVFLSLVVGLFCIDVIRETTGLALPSIPPVLSLELAILLISLKIIWMVSRQTRTDHFQFWILNSIEFQINSLAARLRALEERLDARRTSGAP